jgi:hypothetical protein
MTAVSQGLTAPHLSMNCTANTIRVIHRRDLSRIEKKVSAKLMSFVSETMKENDPDPQFWRRNAFFS